MEQNQNRATEETFEQPFTDYLEQFRVKLADLFRGRINADSANLQRGVPPFIFREVFQMKPQAVSIPRRYGGRGADPAEIIAVLEAASYESLALSLILGINGALFLEPIARLCGEGLKRHIFDRFIKEGLTGGLMITEPDYGTDALSMQTFWEPAPGGYRVKGVKHWAGLTGWADYWIITSRRRRANGSLARDLSLFVCESARVEQRIVVEEYFNNLGLYIIPYGRNLIDVRLPAGQKLESGTSGVKALMDMLHRSRMRFPGMAMGFLKRLLEEAVNHSRDRKVGGRYLEGYDQVQRRLGRMQARVTACAAMCHHAAQSSSINDDLTEAGLVANVHKTVISDFMQESAQSLLQLNGAKGFKQDHIAGRAVNDSRPFQIFEGPNDVIYHQIADKFLKELRQNRETRLYPFLKKHELTRLSAERFKNSLQFTIHGPLPQRKLVNLGRLLARLVVADRTLILKNSGFDSLLAENALDSLGEEIAREAAVYHCGFRALYREAPEQNWMACLPRHN